MTPGLTYQSRTRVIRPGPESGLLGKLARGGLVGRLARVDRARGDLEQGLADRVAIVLDQADPGRIDQGNQGDRAPVNDHLALGGGSVGQLDGLEGQVDLRALIDDASRRRGRGRVGRHDGGAPRSVAGLWRPAGNRGG